MEYYAVHTDDGLYHHGIKGQHWGQRRFQNEDGSVTAAGAQRYYGHSVGSAIKRGLKSNSDKATLVKYGVAGLAVKKAKQHHDNVKAKKEASRKAMEEEGRREDAQEYRHQKSGESVGSAAKRWIKGDSDSATLVKYGVAGLAVKKARQAKAENNIKKNENQSAAKLAEKHADKGKKTAETLLKYGVVGLAVSKARESKAQAQTPTQRQQSKPKTVKAPTQKKQESDAKTLLKYGVAGYAIKKARQRRNKG